MSSIYARLDVMSLGGKERAYSPSVYAKDLNACVKKIINMNLCVNSNKPSLNDINLTI